MAEAERIDGKAVAARIIETVKSGTAALKEAAGTVPGLAVVIIGEDPASQVYVGSKAKTAKECGFTSIKHELPAETSEETLLKVVGDLNADPQVHGILVQLPLPGHIDEAKVIQTIDPDKDVDGFHLINVGRLSTGDTGSTEPVRET